MMPDSQVKYTLKSCVWEITLACCFSCKYCGSNGGKAREGELTTEECLNVADQLAQMGCRRVSLIGGEVFMRRDWPLIVKRLTAGNIAVNIITNGFLFTESIISELLECNIESVSVSLDGPEEIHDKYRQSFSFKRAVQAIDVLCDNGVNVSVITTLNSENVKHLSELYEILKQYPIFAWQLQACSPMGNAANNGIEYAFSPSEVISFVKNNMYDAPFMMGVADNIGYFSPEEGSIRGNMSGKAYFAGCRAGLTAIGIDSVGNVRGCESLYDEAFNEGNLREQTLEEIWNNPEGFKYNRGFSADMITGKCKGCDFSEYCGGGCRSYNHFVHGKMYESPKCARRGE